jgi:diguanylate cyclase (GGDEF)-like protein/PAS domain S-box-containing protein
MPTIEASLREPQTDRHFVDAALGHVTDAIITVDTANNVTFMNAAAESLTGTTFADAVGTLLATVLRMVNIVTGEPIQVTDDAGSTGSEEGTAKRVELARYSMPNILVEYRHAPILDAAGRLRGTVIGFRDITHRRTAELALQTSEEILIANEEELFEERERAQVTLNAIGDAVVSTDFRGCISFLNNVAQKLTGCSQDAASGRLLDEVFILMDAATRERIACPTMQAIIDDRTVRMEADTLLVRQDHSEVAVEISASPIHDRLGGVIGAVMVSHDVTVARDLSMKLARLALHDGLTELPNRALFTDRLNQALARAQRSGHSVGLLFVDLDQFKPVNDSLGHGVGDKLLQSVAQRLLRSVRSSDTVGRFGGDEFLVLLADVEPSQDISLCADKIVQAVNAPYEIESHTLFITASIGIATYPVHATEAETLLKFADMAMYQAKNGGRNRCQLFAPTMVLTDG